MVIKTVKCLLASREGCSKIYWLKWILLGLSVITLSLEVFTNEPKSLWRSGWSFSYQSTRIWAKTCGLKAQIQREEAKINRIQSWLAQFRKWINRHPSICEISALNSNHCYHFPMEKCDFYQSLKLWFRPNELMDLEDAKNKATHTFTQPTLRGSYFRLKLPISDCSWRPHESSALQYSRLFFMSCRLAEAISKTDLFLKL